MVFVTRNISLSVTCVILLFIWFSFGADLPEGWRLEPRSCAYVMTGNTIRYIITEGWSNLPQMFRSMRTDLRADNNATVRMASNCSVSICGVAGGSQYGCKKLNTNNESRNLTQSGSYEIHTTKCVCDDKYFIACSTNCSKRNFNNKNACATFYREPHCWDCENVGVSLEFSDELVFKGIDLINAAQFRSFRLRNGCKLIINYFARNGTILKRVVEKYPDRNKWEDHYFNAMVEAVVYSCDCDCGMMTNVLNADFLPKWPCNMTKISRFELNDVSGTEYLGMVHSLLGVAAFTVIFGLIVVVTVLYRLGKRSTKKILPDMNDNDKIDDTDFNKQVIDRIVATSEDRAIPANSFLWKSKPDLFPYSFQGGGAFGKVFKAVESHGIFNQTGVAVKVVDVGKSLKIFRRMQSSSQYLEKLLIEIEIFSKLAQENIIRCYDCWAEGIGGNHLSKQDLKEICAQSDKQSSVASFFYPNWFLFLKLEYCDFTLDTWIDNAHFIRIGEGDSAMRQMPLVCRDILRVMIHTARGLQYLHSKGYIHRDLKPNNIFCKVEGDDSTWKIGDLGLAVPLNSPTTALSWKTEQAGTSVYRSPEMERGGDDYIATSKSDIYSLGLVYLQLCSVIWSEFELHAKFDALRGDACVKESCVIEILSDIAKQREAKFVDILSKMLLHDINDRVSASQLLVCLFDCYNEYSINSVTCWSQNTENERISVDSNFIELE